MQVLDELTLMKVALRERFVAQGVVDELDAWLATGLSNGRPLRLEQLPAAPARSCPRSGPGLGRL